MSNLAVQSRTKAPLAGIKQGLMSLQLSYRPSGQWFLPLQVFIVQLITAFHHFSAQIQRQCLQAIEDRIGSTSGLGMVTCSHLCAQTACPLSQSPSTSIPPVRQIHFLTQISGPLFQNSLWGSLITHTWGGGGPVRAPALAGSSGETS